MKEIKRDELPFFEPLSLFLRSRQYHGRIGPIDLEEDRILAANLVLEKFGIDELVVLIVRVQVLDEQVEHGARIRDGEFLLRVGGLDDEILGKRGWQNAPDTVRVDLGGRRIIKK